MHSRISHELIMKGFCIYEYLCIYDFFVSKSQNHGEVDSVELSYDLFTLFFYLLKASE